MEKQHVPARAPDRLREIEILLVARKSVQQHDRGVGLRSGCEVEEAVDLDVTGRDRDRFHGRRELRIRRRILGFVG